MKKHDESLFQIGEVAKILGVTRKAILGYEEMATAIRALVEYVKENGIEITGPFRSVYLEGPPNRGENSGDYITQVAVPIRGKQSCTDNQKTALRQPKYAAAEQNNVAQFETDFDTTLYLQADRIFHILLKQFH